MIPTPPSLRRPEAGIPKALDALLGKMLSVDPSKRPQTAGELCGALEALLKPEVKREPALPQRRRGLARSLVAAMSVVVLGIGGAAVAKTPAGERASASIKSAYDHVVKLRADALAHRAPPAPAARAQVAVGAAREVESEPVAAPAIPPAPVEAVAQAIDLDADAPVMDDDGEVEEKDAPAVEGAALAAGGVDLSEEQEVEVKGSEPAEGAKPSDNAALAKADALWEKGAKLRALDVLRKASRKTPNDAALFKALAARAEQTDAWGEAVKAARRWALLDSSSEARLSLARLERATGHKERALALIEGVLKEDPASPDAKTLLGEMRGQKLALSQ